MKHLVALGIKFLLITVIFFLFWPLFGTAPPLLRIWYAFWVTLITYIIGDLIILPAAGNIFALAVDVGLTAVLLLILQYTSITIQISLAGALLLGLFVAVTEWFFHKFVQTAILSP